MRHRSLYLRFYVRLLLTYFLLCTAVGYAQLKNNGIWDNLLENEYDYRNLPLKQLHELFSAQLEAVDESSKQTKDKSKIFGRWFNHWKNYTDTNDYVITPSKIWSDWQQKNQFSIDNSDVSNWTNIGSWDVESKTGIGRINTVAVDPNNSNVYYVGAPSGGIWRSNDSGVTWSPLSDYLPQIGVSGIANTSKKKNTSTLY